MCRVAKRRDFTYSLNHNPRPRRNSVLRLPRQVDFETFNKDYWRRNYNNTKWGLPVDVVFSEIMGVIKGSTSAQTGLRPLTREEYLGKGFRIAPLLASDHERDVVYDMYESYERMKVAYQDWDAIDRAREILEQIVGDQDLQTRLRSLIHELYVDGKFVCIGYCCYGWADRIGRRLC